MANEKDVIKIDSKYPKQRFANILKPTMLDKDCFVIFRVARANQGVIRLLTPDFYKKMRRLLFNDIPNEQLKQNLGNDKEWQNNNIDHALAVMEGYKIINVSRKGLHIIISLSPRRIGLVRLLDFFCRKNSHNFDLIVEFSLMSVVPICVLITTALFNISANRLLNYGIIFISIICIITLLTATHEKLKNNSIAKRSCEVIIHLAFANQLKIDDQSK